MKLRLEEETRTLSNGMRNNESLVASLKEFKQDQEDSIAREIKKKSDFDQKIQVNPMKLKWNLLLFRFRLSIKCFGKQATQCGWH